MKYPVHVEGPELVAVLDRVLQFLGSSSAILFDAMAKVTLNSRSPFVPPPPGADQQALTKKRGEIAAILQAPAMLKGLAIALELFEETYHAVNSISGIPGKAPQELLAILALRTNRPNETISLSQEGRWSVEWFVRSTRSDVNATMSCDWFSRRWGFVVPPSVINYLSSAATAHYQDRNDVAVALLSIAAEATLRDVLSSRGHKFVPGASAVDIYHYSPAHVTADATAGTYTVSFSDPMPLDIATFPTGGMEIKVRRTIKERSSHIDLNIRAASPFYDHWSGNAVETPAVKSIGGLGTALDVARNIEQCLSPEDLAVDFDEVLQAVRNNLVHLSGSALTTRLPRFDSYKTGFTLGDFLNDAQLVNDFVSSISRFVTAQYVELRRSGVPYA